MNDEEQELFQGWRDYISDHLNDLGVVYQQRVGSEISVGIPVAYELERNHHFMIRHDEIIFYMTPIVGISWKVCLGFIHPVWLKLSPNFWYYEDIPDPYPHSTLRSKPRKDGLIFTALCERNIVPYYDNPCSYSRFMGNVLFTL